MQGTFDHTAYHDRYRERLMAIIDKKRKGETITAPKVEERKAPSDLMAALEASLSEAVGRSKAKKRPAAPRRQPKAGTRAKAAKPARKKGAKPAGK